MSHPRISFGCANVGIAWTSPEDLAVLATALTDAGIQHLDTAARYPPTSTGLSERLLGDNGFSAKGFKLTTKILLQPVDGARSMTKDAIGQSISNSLSSLKTNKLFTLYCHGPDRVTPIEEQAAAIDAHYRKGEFEYFGVSNMSPQMLEQWLSISEKNGYVKPSIYQAQYNLLCRGLETALFPLLRQHSINFCAFSPLAGGFLTGKLTFSEPGKDALKGTRFEEDGTNPLGKAFRHWYDKSAMHSAIQQLKISCEREAISMTEASWRWLAFHSALRDEDVIVCGATKVEQIASIADAIAKGRLTQALVDDIDSLWAICEEEGKALIQF